MKINRLLLFFGSVFLLVVNTSARDILWFPQVVVSEHYYNATFPAITSKGKNVHLAWQGEADDMSTDIFYTRSTDGGHKWEIIRTFTKDGISTEPQLISEEENLYLFWYADLGGQKSLYFSRSSDQGLSWGDPKQLTDRISYHYNSTIALDHNRIIIVWQENSSGVYQIHYMSSNDFGKRWNKKKQLTHSVWGATNPQLDFHKNVLLIVWSQKIPNGQNVQTAVSSDWGESWQMQGAEKLGTDFTFAPDISRTDQFAYLVWHDLRNENLEIYGKILSPQRTTDIVQLSENFTPSTSAVVSISGQTIHIASQDMATDKYHIFYRRSTFTRISKPQHVDENSFPNYDNDSEVEFTWSSTQKCSSYKIIVSVNGEESFITNTPTASVILTGENKHLYGIQVFGLDQQGNESLPSSPSATVYTDLYRPRARITAPPQDIYMPDSLPAISFKFSEKETKIKQAVLKIDARDFDVTIAPDQTTLVHIPDKQYSEGKHTYSLSLIDMANNQTVVGSSFFVDYTPPVLTLSPIYINEITDFLLLDGTFEDLGIDKIYSGAAKATINEEEKLFGLKTRWNQSEFNVPINAIDKAGNTSVFIAPVIYDTQKPLISDLTPYSGSKVKGRMVRIAAKIVDVGPAGLNMDMVKLYINNQDVTAESKWEGDYLVYFAPRTERRKNAVAVTATDRAGNEESAYWIYTNARELQFEWIK